MHAKILGLVVSAAALVAACSATTAGVATAPPDVTPFTTTTDPSATAAPGASVMPQEAYDEIRAAGVEGPDSAIEDQVAMACIMASGSFNHSKQDVVDVLTQMGSPLPPDVLMVIVEVALKYECPENAEKLGG
ncbi:hypothetical protein M1247_21480 [Mycobacterium sp. 21AC1]|uniref:hypothetical protein n=1 Tax=[Mycobacterium] appelbergii TaxID=2939269 RepID=UPI002939322F|nr:hypothetical protein [Mycobacterium sp. 21AC1]MDV3127512.1 hypothetical protein [Mycobacterium sp. 21AC1]